MTESWVLNASPVIVLAKVGQLDLMSSMASELLVPDAVVSELLSGPSDDPARIAVESGWGKRISPRETPTSVIEWGLGQGETAVLAVALEHSGALAVLDDAEGRKCARTVGVRVLGTLGIVLRAKKRGLVPSAAGLVRSLRAEGLYIDDQIIREALHRSVGEEWAE